MDMSDAVFVGRISKNKTDKKIKYWVHPILKTRLFSSDIMF